MLAASIYKTAVGINILMIFNDIWRLADQEVWCPQTDLTGIPQTPYQYLSA